MAKPEFKKPEDVHFKQPEPDASELFGGAPAPAPVDDWREMPPEKPIAFGASPFSGFPMELRNPAGGAQVGVWKLSRKYVQEEQRFVPYGFWARYLGGNVEIPFEPSGWRPFVEL